MNIKHRPIFNIEKIVKNHKETDGTPIKYVCTTAKKGDLVMDIFYRTSNEPHPTFKNRYFGLYYDSFRQTAMITDADWIEDLDFTLVENDEGELEYSESQHDFKQFNNGNMIDGGRDYIKSSGCKIYVYHAHNGEMIPFKDLLSEEIQG